MRTASYHPLFIVDDDEDDRYLIDLAFDAIQWNDHIRILHSGTQLLQCLDALPNAFSYPTLILLDYHMPGMNAAEVLQRLKTHETYRSIKVMVYSTEMTDTISSQLVQQGAAACFKKVNYGSEAIEFASHLKREALSCQKALQPSSLICY